MIPPVATRRVKGVNVIGLAKLLRVRRKKKEIVGLSPGAEASSTSSAEKRKPPGRWGSSVAAAR